MQNPGPFPLQLKWLAAFAGSLLLSGCAASPSPSRVGESTISTEPVTPCFVAIPADMDPIPHECGFVVVPQDAAAPDGPRVKLAYLRLEARSESKQAPLFMLAGGPGGTLITPTACRLFSEDYLGPVLDSRDVVLLDQRGAGFSVPRLDCPELDALSRMKYERHLPEADVLAMEREALVRCVTGFKAQGVVLARYHSVAIAADVDAARRALGYDRIVYYGGSYGSQLGQHVMRDFPGMLDAVILDGTNSLSRESWIEDRALDVEFSMRHIAELCRSDAKCSATYDLPDLINRALDLFDDGPIPAVYVDPTPPERRVGIMVTRDDLVALVYREQGSRIGVSSLPYLLFNLIKDGRRSMGEGLAPWIGETRLAEREKGPDELARLMYMAVVCSDDPVRSTDELVLDGAGRYAALFGLAATKELLRYCQIVAVPSLPDSTDVDEQSGIPTLTLSGGLDPATPTFRSEIVARALTNARLVVFPDGTHVQVGAANYCAASIMAAFVAAPAAPLPLQCIEESRPLGFVLPDGTMSQ